MLTNITYKNSTLRALFCSIGLCAVYAASSAMAADVPPAHKASPEIYKVLAEDKKVRVVEATWQPGQRDKWHSHPSMAAYRLTDCKSRVHLANGKTRDRDQKAGFAALRDKPVAKHSFENTGTNVCRILLIELKK